MINKIKQCSKCDKKLEANADNFHRNSSSKDGFCDSCKSCRILASREWEKNNPDKRKKWLKENRHRNMLRYEYRMMPEQYEAILSSQGGVCAVCEQPQNGKRKKLFVDHDHSTGGNRGLLCIQCNAALERMETIPDWHEKAIRYLTKFALAKMEKEFK